MFDRIINYMNKNTTVLYTILGALMVPGFLLLWIGFSLWAAWAVITLWAWFAVPIFGLPMLGYWQAVGLGLLLSALRPHNNVTNEKSWNAWARGIVGPPLLVLFCWLSKSFSAM